MPVEGIQAISFQTAQYRMGFLDAAVTSIVLYAVNIVS